VTRSPTSPRNSQPIGVVLAGGPGIRIGGAKPTVALRGQPLVRYPVGAMKLVLSEVAVIAKADTSLPQLLRTMVWVEPDLPVDPLLGITEALTLAGGRPVLVCPVDMPFVSPESLSALAGAQHEGRPAVVATCRGVARPLLGCYLPSAVPLLEQAVRDGLSPDDAARTLDPVLFEFENDDELFDVDTPDDLLQASAMLDVRSPSRTR
jgi:molybdopterin-guanine dinucleotide biosynthesis protein A